MPQIDESKVSGGCFHCGDRIDGNAKHENDHEFCCNGCLTAFQIIRDAGHLEYYRYRTDFAPRPREGSDATYAIFEESHPRNAEGTVTAVFLVEGIHCASCVWINELVLRDIPGVVSAEVRLSTGRAYLTWRPAHVPLATIAAATARLGYRLVPLGRTGEPQAELRSRSLLQRMAVAGFFAGNMMLLSVALYAGYFDHMDRPTKNTLHLVAFLFSLPVLLYSAMPILRGGLAAIRLRTPTMDLLTSLGISLAFAYSVHAGLFERGEVFFDSIAFVVFVLLIGRFVEERLRARMLFFVENLAPARTTIAHKKSGSRWQDVEVSDVRPGDLLRVAGGEFVPVDGRLLSETAEVDTAILTGEFQPQAKTKGESIASGARVIGNPIEIQALSDAHSGLLGHITQLADSSMKEEPRFARVAERASRWFIGFVLFAGAGTFAFWFDRDIELAVLHTVTLLIAACPCALNLSVPTVYTAALQRAFSSGCLVSGGPLLETLAHVDTIAFDKTGTLTEGKLRIVGVETGKGYAELAVLRIAAALQAEAALRHPVAEAFLVRAAALAEAVEQSKGATGGGPLPASEKQDPRNVSYEPGRGLRGTIGENTYLLGSQTFLREEGVLESDLQETAAPGGHDLPAGSAHLKVILAERSPNGPNRIIAEFLLEDRLRPEAADVMKSLRPGRQLLLLSGDSERNAQAVAQQLGLDEVHASLRPEEKTAIIRSFQKSGRTIVMVGDGINDAPSLRAADCGVSFAGASDASIVRADVVLVDADLRRLVGLFRLAGAAQRKVRQNLALSFLYNAALLPLAFLGYVAPVAAAALMALSSISVLTNSLFLRR